jgi:hypothetical protein
MISELENSHHKPRDFECFAQETEIQRDHKEHNKISKSYRITDTHYLAILMIDVFSQFKTKNDSKKGGGGVLNGHTHTHKIDAGTQKYTSYA